MPDLTGNGIFGTVPGADEIADAVMKRILAPQEQNLVPRSCATLVSSNPTTILSIRTKVGAN
jgi:hypothetical protein